MIRASAMSDKFRAMTLLREFFDSSAEAIGFAFPYEAAYAERLFLHHHTTSQACCLVHEVAGVAQGILMAAAYDHPFGPVRVAKETVWWITPEHRGRAAIKMLDAYEAWARERHCTFVGMAGMGADPVVADLYRRRGYGAAETHFLKAL